MPKNRKEYEAALLSAFDMGMNCAYAVEHTERSDDERIYRNRYKALIQGKIKGMDEVINNEKTFTERSIPDSNSTGKFIYYDR